MSVIVNRKKLIEERGEEVAIQLVKDGLVSTDASLAGICKRLERFKGVLSGKSFNETQARTLIRNGFRAVRLKVNPDATDDAEVLRLLNGLVDKLDTMASMGLIS